MSKSLKCIYFGKYLTTEFYVLEYSPCLTKLFYYDFQRMSWKRRVRFIFELIKGYKIFYLKVKGNIVAQCVVSKGGGRYFFASKNDIVVGPFFVREEYRGNSYSEIIMNSVLNKLNIPYNYAYAWVAINNIPSLKCTHKCGFKTIGSINETKFLRLLRPAPNNDGEFYLFRFKNKERFE